MMHVYEIVRDYLDSHGIKQITIAEKAGFQPQTFNAMMNGKRTMHADDLRAICIALNVSPEVFIDIGDDSMSKKNRTAIKSKGPAQPNPMVLNVGAAIENLHDMPNELETYAWIMSRFNKTDVSSDVEFQHKFNVFYKLIRRNAEQKKAFYELFEACKSKSDVDFSYIIRTLYEKTGWVESSFSSKLLATLKPDMPIWDSIVLARLGLKSSGSDNKEKRLAASEVLYDSIVEWYQDFIPTQKAKEAIAAFDAAFPQYIGFSATKKIDFLLWGSGLDT